MLNLLIGPALELGKEFIKGKADEKKAIQERKINAIQNDANWEEKMASATDKSWKDEWLVHTKFALLGVAYSVIIDDPGDHSRFNEGI
jgi:hypothetical protein